MASDIIKAESFQDFTRKQRFLERLADRLGACIAFIYLWEPLLIAKLRDLPARFFKGNDTHSKAADIVVIRAISAPVTFFKTH